MQLYSHQQAQRYAQRAKRWSIAALIVALAALTGCIICCCQVTTATALMLENRAIWISVIGGWIVIFLLTMVVIPNRHAAQHESNILSGEQETVTGTVTVEPEVLQIPKSIAICKVVVATPLQTCRRSIRADKASLLAAYDGKCMTLHTVFGYITDFEEAL